MQATRDGDTEHHVRINRPVAAPIDCQVNDVGHSVEHRDFGESISAAVLPAVLLVGKAANRNPRVAAS